VVAELDLDQVAALRVPVHEPLEAPDPLLALRPEQAIQAHEQHSRARAQQLERPVGLALVLGHGRRRRGSALAGLHARHHAVAHERPGPLLDRVGLGVADALLAAAAR
jgi:hypothetical protein